MINTGDQQGHIGTASRDATRACLPRCTVALCDAAANDPAAAIAVVLFVVWIAAGALL